MLFYLLGRAADGAVEIMLKLIVNTYENDLRSLGEALRGQRPTAALFRVGKDQNDA